MTQATPETKPYAPKVKERTVIVVRLGEITLKKKNRPFFVRQLGRNIRTALKGLPIKDTDWNPQRIVITPGAGFDWPELRSRLLRVFGLRNFSP
ncbi:MAG: hypothetical protein IIB85_05915, partial [Chloroflexi bacterium]|nr:hypothetical protein [Chloroflexota bacterium]